MKLKTDTAFTTDPPVFLLKDLTVRALKDEKHSQAGQLLEQEHYLGDCPKGRQLVQVVEHKGQWVALLDWGPACWKLAGLGWAGLGWVDQRHFTSSPPQTPYVSLSTHTAPDNPIRNASRHCDDA